MLTGWLIILLLYTQTLKLSSVKTLINTSMLLTEFFFETKKITAKNDPCWSGYHMVGTKKNGAKPVPNCVPGKKEVRESTKGSISSSILY